MLNMPDLKMWQEIIKFVSICFFASVRVKGHLCHFLLWMGYFSCRVPAWTRNPQKKNWWRNIVVKKHLAPHFQKWWAGITQDFSFTAFLCGVSGYNKLALRPLSWAFLSKMGIWSVSEWFLQGHWLILALVFLLFRARYLKYAVWVMLLAVGSFTYLLHRSLNSEVSVAMIRWQNGNSDVFLILNDPLLMILLRRWRKGWGETIQAWTCPDAHCTVFDNRTFHVMLINF